MLKKLKEQYSRTYTEWKVSELREYAPMILPELEETDIVSINLFGYVKCRSKCYSYTMPEVLVQLLLWNGLLSYPNISDSIKIFKKFGVTVTMPQMNTILGIAAANLLRYAALNSKLDLETVNIAINFIIEAAIGKIEYEQKLASFLQKHYTAYGLVDRVEIVEPEEIALPENDNPKSPPEVIDGECVEDGG